MGEMFDRVVIIAAVFIVIMTISVYGSDQIPAPLQKQPIALTGGIIHTVNSGIIHSGVILFDKGKIVDIGTNSTIPADAVKLDINGLHVYPGLIETVSQLGLAEINSVRATVDYSETGEINPNVRAETAVNPDSERIPVTRSNGVSMAVSVPEGGLISGKAALMMLDGWTWEDMTLKAPVGMVIHWPNMRATDAYGKQKSLDEHRKQVKEQLDKIEQTFRDARAYKAARDADGQKDVPFHKADVRWEAMIPVLNGELPVWVWADRKQEIVSAVDWADREQLKMVLVGGADSPLVTDLLQRKNIPVIITPILRLPNRRDADYDEQFTVPKKLFDAGVTFCIAGGDGMGNDRNLPYHAAMSAAYGLPKDEALKAITLYAARIAGVDGRAGSLEVGKDATLIITDGDPLEITTTVHKLFIQGRDIDLNDRHKMLYHKYSEKYRQAEGN
ncbi:MAG: amidohydrolase family protein [Candidatus Latescibacteria bacterium]|nr:amidohydrolase family protein [Candidatus Latescibacterota bacterium]